MGAALAPQRRSPRSTRAVSRKRSSRSRRRTACSRSTSTRAATPAWRSWPHSSRCTPKSRASRITAGNACGANDGAAVLAIASDRLGCPRWHGRAWASVGVDPAVTGLAPVRGHPESACSRRAFRLSDVDLFEINEAFASMCVATIRLLDLDPDRVNVNGSGCSLGHPVAATGARMLVTLVHELRRRGGGIGVAAMCAGGGMGSATVIEVAAP